MQNNNKVAQGNGDFGGGFTRCLVDKIREARET